jgi:hypothetical protein
MKMNVLEKTIHINRPSNAQEKESADIEYSQGQFPHEDMIDKRIESPENRETLNDGEGEIAITVQAGDKLGELSFNIQFEGPRKQYDFCMQGQNELLLNTCDWLRDILGEFAVDFDIKIEAKPCPMAEQTLEIDNAALVLEKKITALTALTQYRQRITERVRARERQGIVHEF